MNKFLRVSVYGLLLFTVSSYANHTTKKPPSPWDGTKASLGYTATSGSKSTSSFASAVDIKYVKKRFTGTFDGSYQFATDSSEVIKKQILYKDQLSYSFNDNAKIDNYAYLNNSYQTNKFTAYKSMASLSVGYGRDWIKEKDFSFSTQLGPAYRWLTTQQPDSTESKQLAYMITGSVTWDPFGAVEISEQVDFTGGKPADHIISTTALSNKLSARLAVSLNYVYEYWSKIPAGSGITSKQNASTSVNIVYSLS